MYGGTYGIALGRTRGFKVEPRNRPVKITTQPVRWIMLIGPALQF